MRRVIALQLHAKVVELEVGDGDTARDVLEVQHLLLQLLKLLAAVHEVVHLFGRLALEHVLLAGGAGVHERHAALHAALELDVLVELDVRPEVDELDLGVGRSQAVDSPEALDDAHGVPVDVVVHQAVAVLEVLALGDAVGGEDHVYLALLPLALGQLLGHRGEAREHVLERGPRQLEGMRAAPGPGDLGALEPQFLGEASRQLVEQVVDRVGERAEHEHLAVARVVRVADLLLDELLELDELGIALGRHRVGVLEKLSQLEYVVVEVLTQPDGVHVAQVDLHLAALLELLGVILVVELCVPARGVVGGARRLRVEFAFERLGAFEYAAQRYAEAVHGGLHAFEQVHPHEVGYGGGAVHLALEVLAPGVPVAILVVRHLVEPHVGEQLVLRKGELGDHVVELAYGRKLPREVDGGLERQGLAALREGARRRPVVLHDVLAAARDGEHVEQLEVVGVHHCGEALRGALAVLQLAPLVEALLRHARHLRDGGDAVAFREVGVVALGDELYLVAQVEQAVVHGSRRKHEDLGAAPALDDVLDQARVAVLLLGVGGLVAEVMRLVYDQEVEVAPPQVLQVDLAALAVVTREVGVVEHRVAEAVVGERVAVVVVVGPQRPVVPQALRAQQQHAGVPLLVVFDHGERLVGLAQAHAVGDDAALVLLELADGAHHGVLLEVVELVPHDGVREVLHRGHRILLDVVEVVPEQVVEREEVDELRRVLAVERLDLRRNPLRHVLDEGGIVPYPVEHRLEPHSLLGRLEMAHPSDDVGLALVAEPLEREGVRGGSHERLRLPSGVVDVVGAGRADQPRLPGGLEGRASAHPFRALARERALVDVVAQRELETSAADAPLAVAPPELELARLFLALHPLGEGGLAEHESQLRHLGELLFQLAVGEDREVGRDDGELGVLADGLLESVAEALPSRVVQVFQGLPPLRKLSDEAFADERAEARAAQLGGLLRGVAQIARYPYGHGGSLAAYQVLPHLGRGGTVPQHVGVAHVGSSRQIANCNTTYSTISWQPQSQLSARTRPDLGVSRDGDKPFLRRKASSRSRAWMPPSIRDAPPPPALHAH